MCVCVYRGVYMYIHTLDFSESALNMCMNICIQQKIQNLNIGVTFMALWSPKIQNNPTTQVKSIEDQKQTQTLCAACWDDTPGNSLRVSGCSVKGARCYCSHVLHNDVSVNAGPHIGLWSNKTMELKNSHCLVVLQPWQRRGVMHDSRVCGNAGVTKPTALLVL